MVLTVTSSSEEFEVTHMLDGVSSEDLLSISDCSLSISYVTVVDVVASSLFCCLLLFKNADSANCFDFVLDSSWFRTGLFVVTASSSFYSSHSKGHLLVCKHIVGNKMFSNLCKWHELSKETA